MKVREGNFNMKAEIEKWPYKVQKLFKEEALHLGLCTKGTYNQWRTYGIPPHSTSLVMIKKLIAKYDNMLQSEPLEITLSRSIA